MENIALSQIIRVALHHTGVSVKRQLYAVNRYHKKKWNMKSTLGWYIAYNYFIEKNGTTTYARKIGEETMAQKGHNFDTISICLAGNFNEEYPTEAQNNSLRSLIREIEQTYPLIKITTHRALQENRVCPGFLLTDKHIENLLKEPEKNSEEEEKEKKIKELQSTIDKLINFIASYLK